MYVPPPESVTKLIGVKYQGWPADEAVKHYLARMRAKIPHFETMEEPELNYIKVWTDAALIILRIVPSN